MRQLPSAILKVKDNFSSAMWQLTSCDLFREMLAKDSQFSGTKISHYNAPGWPAFGGKLSLQTEHRQWTEPVSCLSCHWGTSLSFWSGSKKQWRFLGEFFSFPGKTKWHPLPGLYVPDAPGLISRFCKSTTAVLNNALINSQEN
jgi:hypothetical protein